MVERVKVVVTLTGYYTPDLSDIAYRENGITTTEDAIALDFKDLMKGEIDIYALCDEVEHFVEVIDVT